MSKMKHGAWGAVLALALTLPAWAHFQVLKPSTDIVTAAGPRDVTLDIRFTHPMEDGPVMAMGQPAEFGVIAQGVKRDLRSSLIPVLQQGRAAYTVSYAVTAPGDYVFYLAPAPYYDATERRTIIQYTKVVVNGLGLEQGWDVVVGLPVEIAPLVRPYGLWTGNLFRGIVLQDGQPAPYATIEVEYLNQDRRVTVPPDMPTTQVIKADANGAFAYAMPRAGWWGFAAVIDGQPMPGPHGGAVPVELGGVMWVRVQDMNGEKR